MKAVTDETLIQGLKSGNEKFLNQIYDIYHVRIYAFAFSLLKNKDASNDVVQDVFLKLWEKRTTLNEDTKITALLFTMTRNCVLSLFRKKASKDKYEGELFFIKKHESVNTTEQDVAFHLLKERIDHYLSKQPAKRKRVYELSRYKGLSNKAIAEKLSISEKTVEDHMTRVLRTLRKHINTINSIIL